jgi:hypothetical protein
MLDGTFKALVMLELNIFWNPDLLIDSLTNLPLKNLE